MCGLNNKASADKALPSEFKSTTTKFKRTKGDGLDLTIPEILENSWIDGDGCKVAVGLVNAMLRQTGDGCRLRVSLNSGTMVITGDGCNVAVDRNDGLLRVTGDGCQVRVRDSAHGTIEYLGDGGQVALDKPTDSKKVYYKGQGGVVEIGGDKGKRKIRPEKPKTKVEVGDTTDIDGRIYVAKIVNGEERIKVKLNNTRSLRINIQQNCIQP